MQEGRHRAPVSTGVEALDALLGGGLPAGSLAAVDSAVGRGGLRLAALLLAAGTRGEARAAVVDPTGTLHPPGLHAAGVRLSRLLVVRPPDAACCVRAAEELLRHGAFPSVVILALEPSAPQARRLLLAAEAGRSVGVLVGEGRAAARAPCATRLSIDRGDGLLTVRVARRRGGPADQSVRMEHERGLESHGVRLAGALPSSTPAARAAGA